MRCGPKSLFHEHRNFGGGDGRAYVDQKRDGGEPGQQAEYQQGTAHNFHHAHKRRGEMGERDPDLLESSHPQCRREQEFLDAFGQEHEAYEKADKNYGTHDGGGVMLKNRLSPGS